VPQIVAGLHAIPIATCAVFINNTYRKCSYSQFIKDDISYDTSFYTGDVSPSKTADEKERLKQMVNSGNVYAKGIIYFILEKTASALSAYKQISGCDKASCLLDLDGDAENIWKAALLGGAKSIDFGSASLGDTEKILKMYSERTIKTVYSDIIIDEFAVSEIPFLSIQDLDEIAFATNNTSLKNIEEFHTDVIEGNFELDSESSFDSTVIGFMPWKLLISDVILQERDNAFVKKMQTEIEKHLPVLEKLNKTRCVKEKIKMFFEHYPEQDRYLDRQINKILETAPDDDRLLDLI
jgi:hypothetical protein